MAAPVIEFRRSSDASANSTAERPRRGRRRPVFDASNPAGFVRYPYYSVREVAQVLFLSDDAVRRLFRNGRQGRVLEIVDPKPGKRAYRTLLIPYATLAEFIRRFSKERQATGT
jgi:hypothetical protein